MSTGVEAGITSEPAENTIQYASGGNPDLGKRQTAVKAPKLVSRDLGKLGLLMKQSLDGRA